jgi:hypothetical protein
MLATLAALQLVVLAQVAPPPKEVTAADVADEAPLAQSTEQNPPLPRKGESAPPPAPSASPSPSAAPAAPPAPPAAPRRPRQLSLLSAEPLGGGSAGLAWAGWSSLGLMYGQGLTERDDLAGFVDYDYAKSELRLGALYRRPLGKMGDFDMAGRLSAAWYLNTGAKYFYEDNHADSGLEIVPGLAISQRAAGGIFSGLLEAPLTLTTKYGAGILFSPRISAAYEAPLYPELTIGARVGVGYRAGSGDAPLSEGRGEFLFLVTAGYQFL